MDSQATEMIHRDQVQSPNDQTSEIQSNNIQSANISNTADEALAAPDLEAQLPSAPIDLQWTTPIPNNSSSQLTTDTNVTPTVLQSFPPQKGQRWTSEELQAKLKAVSGRTSSVTRQLPLDSAPKKEGMHVLHRSQEEFRAKLDAVQGKHTATSQDVPPSTAVQSMPQKGLRRTLEEREAKLQAVSGRTSSITRHLPLDSAPKKKAMHGLHRSQEEFRAKLDTVQGKHTATSQEVPPSSMVQSWPQKGLRRSPEEREAKLKAVSGRTSVTNRHANRDNGSQSHTVRAQDPQGWVNDSDILDEDQSQVSSNQSQGSFEIAAELNQVRRNLSFCCGLPATVAHQGYDTMTTKKEDSDDQLGEEQVSPDSGSFNRESKTKVDTPTSQDIAANVTSTLDPVPLIPPQPHGLHFFSNQPKSRVRESDGVALQEAMQGSLGDQKNNSNPQLVESSTSAAAQSMENCVAFKSSASAIAQSIENWVAFTNNTSTAHHIQSQPGAFSVRPTGMTHLAANESEEVAEPEENTVDPPSWDNDPDMFNEDLSQESSAIVAESSQNSERNCGPLSLPAEGLPVGQYIDSYTPDMSRLPPSQPPITNRIPVSVMDMALATTDRSEGLVEARAVNQESTLNILQEAQEVDTNLLAVALQTQAERKRKERQCRRIGYCLLAGSLVIISLSLGIGLGLNKGESTTYTTAPSMEPCTLLPSAAPTGHLDLLQLDLPDYTKESLQNYSTPQWQAFEWLSNHQIVTNLPEWRKKQLFALATFFYAFQGEKWPKKVREDWMDDEVDECLWFSNIYGYFDGNGTYVENEFPFGRPCNGNGEFQVLSLANLGLKLANSTLSIPPEVTFLSSLSVLALPENNLFAQITSLLPSVLYQIASLTEFSMPGNSIQGKLPSELGLLTYMTSLDMSWNKLSGSIPSELGLMTYMISLDMSRNKLSGSIPSELGLMTQMPYLAMYSNSLSGSIPSELDLMTSLTHLDMSSNSLTGSIPSELWLMTSLWNLDLSVNSLSGSLPSEMGLMNFIGFLYMSSNSLSGSIPSELGSMKRLIDLRIYNNSLTGSIPSELGLLTEMMYLDIEHNSLNGSIPSELGSMKRLIDLYIYNNSLTGSIPSELGLLTEMIYLDIDHNSLNGSVPSELGLMTKIEVLYLANNSFSGLICSEIEELTSLVELTIQGNYFSGTIPSSLGHLTHMAWLDLSDLTMLTGSIPSELALLTSLRFFNLSGSSGLSGSIPFDFCHLQDSLSCSFINWFGQNYSCYLDFDCTDTLCGCDCPCVNGTVSNETAVSLP
jgi:Leucine-rich repeat (LRR) protein